MHISFGCGRQEIGLTLPDGARVYASLFPPPETPADKTVLAAVRAPVGARPMADALRARRAGDVVVVVSDVTRPIPYAQFLPGLLLEIEEAGVARDDIIVLVATGMHRPSTAAEQREMYGDVAGKYRIVNHVAQDDANLVELPGTSWSGARVRVNRYYVEAGFRLVTGLVEPHFMAGFSGGRKSVCPGLCSLETVCNFHGYAFLSDPLACNGSLSGNPCHEEAVSVARMAPPDFSLNVVLNRDRQVVRAFAGDVMAAHAEACDFVRDCACPSVATEADVVVTSCGGYPLDATFYQCVKGMVSCLPAVRRGGVIVSFAGCSEGIGSVEYTNLMRGYTGRWRQFIEDIQKPGCFVKDQWELQMQTRVLEKVGQDGLHFVTDGLSTDDLAVCFVNGHAAASGEVGPRVQELLDGLVKDGATVAAFPEGPYCAPVAPLR